MDRRLAEFQATVEVLDTVSSGRALAVVDALGSPTRCTDFATLARVEPLWPNAQAKANAKAMTADLARVAAMRLGGNAEGAEALGSELVDAALATGALPLEAEARLQLGVVLEMGHRPSEASAMLYRAVWAAEASAHAVVAATAWIRIAEFEANVEHDADAAQRAIERGSAAVLRDGDPESDIQLQSVRALLQYQRGEYETSVQTSEALLAEMVEILGPSSHNAGVLHGNLSAQLSALGRYTEAVEHAKTCLKIQQGRVSESSPALLQPLNLLGTAQVYAGDNAAGTQTLTRALKIAQEHAPEGSGVLTQTLSNLGSAYLKAEAYEDAVVMLERAVALDRTIFGNDAVQVAIGLGNLGVAQAKLGRTERALANVREAFSIHQAKQGPDHPNTARAHVDVARALIALGEHDEAIDRLGRAFGVFAKSKVSPVLRASGHYELARAYQGKGDRAKVLEHARQAASMARSASPPRQSIVDAAMNLSNDVAVEP